MTEIKGCFISRHGPYEFEAEWHGHEVKEWGDTCTPDLYTAVVDSVDILSCCDTSDGDGQMLLEWPGSVDTAALERAQDAADSGDYTYIRM